MKIILTLLLLLILPQLALAKGFTVSELKINLEKEIEEELKVKNITVENIKVQREGGGGKIFTLEQVENAKIADSLEIDDLDIISRKFKAEITSEKGKFKLIAKGDIVNTIKVPVLSEDLKKGSEITQDYVEFIEIPKKNIKATSVLDISELLAMVTNRDLKKHNQILNADIKRIIAPEDDDKREIKSIKIPVLTSNIPKDTEITQNYIDLIDIPEQAIKDNTVLDIKDLLGTVAARNLNKQAQISFADIKKPTIIKRNDVVQAIYQVKNMEIKTLAIAQKDASIDDIIQFQNFDSKKIFDAKVNQDGKAIVNFEEREIILKK